METVSLFPNGNSVLCAGCHTCKLLCPTHAISVDAHPADGPVMSVNQNLCVHCNLCSSRCPQCNCFTPDRASLGECFAVMASDEIRIKSASGGAFPVLASAILARGGVVCGAVWNGFQVEHVLASTTQELAAMYESKYVRSNLNDIYARIAVLLEQHRPVLFTGCPCQVAGLYAFLGGDHNQLITIDLICHFAPGAELFDRYLTDCYPRNSLRSIRFRPKERSGWNATTLLAEYTDGRCDLKSVENDPYLKGYHSRVLMPSVCEACRYSGDTRQGDLTIGDFWFIDQYRKDLDDKKGTSILLLNSEKGRCLFEQAQTAFQRVEKVPSDLLHTNRPARSQAYPQRDRFLQSLHQGNTFRKALEIAMEYPYDLGIVSIWSEPNYGSELTYYALYRVITQMGLKALMIERPVSAAWKAQSSDKTLFQNFPYPANAIAPLYQDTIDMYRLNDMCRGFMVGSDQMWHPQLYRAFGEFSFLNFVQENKLKIAYATSFGCDQWQSDAAMQRDILHSLQRFDAISVRESSGMRLLKDAFGLSGDLVLDPIFLCGRHILDELSAKANRKPAGPFLGAYILDITAEKKNAVLQYASKHALPVNFITDARQHGDAAPEDPVVVNNASLEEWIYNFAMADFVITDSYHGMCLCLLFHKQFFCIANTSRGLTRFKSLLSMLHLEDRLVMNSDELLQKSEETPPVDFEKVDAILQPWIEKSRQWLKNALNLPKSSELTEMDYVQKKLLPISDQLKNARSALSVLQPMADSLADHQEKLVAHGTMLLRFDSTLSQHDQRLTDDERFLSQHQTVLEDHGKMLLDHESRIAHMDRYTQEQAEQTHACEQQLSEMRRQIHDMSDALQHYLKFMTQLSEQYHDLQRSFDVLQQENADLRQQLDRRRSFRNRSPKK